MTDKAAEALTKQLKVLNFWITTFGTLFLITLAIIGFLLFQAITFVREAGDKLTATQKAVGESLDVKSKLCSGNNGVTDFFKKNTGACD